jgi:hypothetical protein
VADWEPSRPLLTAYELHLADGQARFVSLSYRMRRSSGSGR